NASPLLSKLRDAFRSRSILYLETCFGHVPLPLGEGGAKRRVRAGNAPSSGPSGHLLPEGEGHEPRFRLIWTPVMQARREAQARYRAASRKGAAIKDMSGSECKPDA